MSIHHGTSRFRARGIANKERESGTNIRGSNYLLYPDQTQDTTVFLQVGAGGGLDGILL